MTKSTLADVAQETHAERFAPIDWVGMDKIEVPVLLKQNDGNYRLPARADAKVSLDKKPSRGIHMSRLYLIVQEHLPEKEFSLDLLGHLTDEFLRTHADLSSKASVKVSFEAPVKRPALKSQNKAWRSYPVTASCVNEDGQKNYFLEVIVTYSSTCPASAALSRQLIQESFKTKFASSALNFESIHEWLGTTDGIVATPHAQRSLARVKVQVPADYHFLTLIDALEDSLQTAVQGAVKREDEQEFALRNGQNLMFCEDAVRRVKATLDAQTAVLDYVAEMSHIESLHPHDAVSFITKGLKLRTF